MNDSPILSVNNLSVAFDVDGQMSAGVVSASFDVGHDEIVAIVGESGSGKSVTALSVLGLLPENTKVTGSVQFNGRELVGMRRSELRAIRGSDIAMIFQDPMTALNPVFTVGFQLGEAIRAHDSSVSRAQARTRALELLEMVEIPDPETKLRNYPHQFSGGQAQRIVIAMALANDPALLIADEPTTALDVTVQAEILGVLRRMRTRLSSSVLVITHDMGVVADLADRVVVMRDGLIEESKPVQELFDRPESEYTKQLLAAVPRFGTRYETAESTEEHLALDVQNLVVEYGSRLRGRVRAVDGVSFSVRQGEILGVVGESGSGKTTIGKAVIGLAPISSGTIDVAGTSISDATRRDRQRMRRTVGVVFQNPTLSLNPRYSIQQTVAEPLSVIAGLRGDELQERTAALLESVGLGSRWLQRFPHELSGGQRQRVGIARAVALEPRLLIADEPTSALDVSVQAQVLDVFRELQERLGFACVFISHDLAVVDTLCDRVAVMHRGTIVEQGTRSEVLAHPSQEYTRRLIDSAPVPDPAEQRRRRERAAA